MLQLESIHPESLVCVFIQLEEEDLAVVLLANTTPFALPDDLEEKKTSKSKNNRPSYYKNSWRAIKIEKKPYKDYMLVG